MNISVEAVLALLALVLFLLAGLGVTFRPRISLGWIGMFFLTLAFIVYVG